MTNRQNDNTTDPTAEPWPKDEDCVAEPERPYDLEERTAAFGESVIDFAKNIPPTPVSRPLASQLVRSATSVGANYCEADDAESRKDFRHKTSLCKKEARETKHRLRMVARAEPDLREEAKCLWQEARQLHLIFAAIGRKKDSS